MGTGTSGVSSGFYPEALSYRLPTPEPTSTPPPTFRASEQTSASSTIVSVLSPMVPAVAKPIPNELQRTLPDSLMNQPISREAQLGFADRVARGFRNFGAWAEGFGFGSAPNASATALNATVGAAASNKEISDAANKSFVSWQIRDNTFQKKLNPLYEMKEIVPSNVEPTLISKGFSILGKTFDAVTNVGNVAVEFKRDYDKGDKSYTNTMVEIIGSTAQIGVTTLVGTAAAGATAVFAGAMTTAALPVIVGIGVGAGASYVVGKGFDYLKSYFKS